ncbi:MAG: ribonuclease P protein component [Hyphomicrobium sp.]
MALTTLKKRSEFLRVRGGPRWSTPALVVEARLRPGAEGDAGAPRVGFTISKKIGNAVVRNRVRRRLRAAIRTIEPAPMRPGYDYVVIARTGAADRAYKDLKAELEQALQRVHQPGARGRRSPKPR